MAKPEARAAVAAGRGRIHLRERLEELADLVGGDADAGVRNGELHCAEPSVSCDAADA